MANLKNYVSEVGRAKTQADLDKASNVFAGFLKTGGKEAADAIGLSPARRELHRSYSAASKTRIETEAKTVSKSANRSADLPSALKTSSTRVRDALVKNGDLIDKTVTQQLRSNELERPSLDAN